jgi:hypothetical protein
MTHHIVEGREVLDSIKYRRYLIDLTARHTRYRIVVNDPDGIPVLTLHSHSLRKVNRQLRRVRQDLDLLADLRSLHEA